MLEHSAVVIGEHSVPVAALPALRGAARVYRAHETPAVETLLEQARAGGVVLVCADGSDPAAAALRSAGAPVYGPAPGERLAEAVTVMDRLRSPGGCPWDAVQTHDSLRRYLIEETYELLAAIEDGDRTELREELGDVLLQVLFHARLAEEERADPFGIDEVAEGLVAKLIGRHPHLFSGGEPVADAQAQNQRWDELKQAEKRRESTVDGVAMGQPAAALAGKLVSRVLRAGFPTELCTEEDGAAGKLFAAVAEIAAQGGDPEGELRERAKRFAARVRAVEAAARAEDGELTAEGWRRHWEGAPP